MVICDHCGVAQDMVYTCYGANITGYEYLESASRLLCLSGQQKAKVIGSLKLGFFESRQITLLYLHKKLANVWNKCYNVWSISQLPGYMYYA